MSVIALIELSPQPGAIDEYLAGLVRVIDAQLDREECESAAVLCDRDDPTRVVVIERWRERADQERYLTERRGDPEFRAFFVGHTIAPPRVRFLDEVDGCNPGSSSL